MLSTLKLGYPKAPSLLHQIKACAKKFWSKAQCSKTERNGQNLLQQRPEPRCSGARHSSVLRKLHATFTASPSSSMNHRRLHHPQHQHHRVSHHLILVAAVGLITQYRRQSVSVIIARTTSIPVRTIGVAVALVSRFLHFKR